MNAIQLRIIKRVVKNRLANGEDFDSIIKDYPKLTESEIVQIKAELGV